MVQRRVDAVGGSGLAVGRGWGYAPGYARQRGGSPDTGMSCGDPGSPEASQEVHRCYMTDAFTPGQRQRAELSA